MREGRPGTTQVDVAFLEELRGRVAACVGDAEGKEAVERHKMLTLTKGQVGLLDEALQLIDVALAALRRRSP